MLSGRREEGEKDFPSRHCDGTIMVIGHRATQYAIEHLVKRHTLKNHRASPMEVAARMDLPLWIVLSLQRQLASEQ